MDAAVRGPLGGMTYVQARRLVVAGGLAVLGLIVLIMVLRGVETVEIVAVLLFVPVFLAVLAWNVLGGAVAGLLASGAYLAMRASAIHAIGIGSFYGLIGSRVLGFLVFGVVGGWANQQLRSSLTKLDLYDQVDDVTGLFNARFFVQDTALEAARAKRYSTLFAIVLVDVPLGALAPLNRRQQLRAIKEFGRLLRDSVRSVDRAVHAFDGERHRLAVVLPETGGPGAQVFYDRLAARVREFLVDRGATADGIEGGAHAFPADEHVIERLRSEFAAIDHVEHPTVPAATAP